VPKRPATNKYLILSYLLTQSLALAHSLLHAQKEEIGNLKDDKIRAYLKIAEMENKLTENKEEIRNLKDDQIRAYLKIAEMENEIRNLENRLTDFENQMETSG